MAAPAVIALCIIYNHSFIKNVEVLDRLYFPSFDQILHIVPNYRSARKEVLTAYRSSHVFQGYLETIDPRSKHLRADYFAFCSRRLPSKSQCI